MDSSPARDSYDLAVIGAGMSGLTAGALLARAGRNVLVVESDARPGGHARSIEADDYRFDRAVHLIMGGNPEGPYGAGLVLEVLELLGVDDRCELVPVDPFYTARFPGLTLEVPAGRDAYVAAHVEHFPDEEQGLTELVELCSHLYREYLDFPIRPRLIDWPSLPLRYPKLVRHVRTTLAKVTDRYLNDARLKAAYSALAPGYLGLPPSRVSFLDWALMMASYIEEGAFYCRGGFQNLADVFAAAVEGHGGELVLGQPVERILIDDHQVRGIRLRDGHQIAVRQVVATIDARDTFGTLIEPSELPKRWMRRIHTTDLSMSTSNLYLGTDLDVASFGAAMENDVWPTWDLEAAFRADPGHANADVTVTIPTLVDPSLAPAGHHQVVIMGTANDDPTSDPAADAAHYVRLAEQVIPGLGHHITYALGAQRGPSGPDRLPLHRIDAIYGWSNTPGNSGPFRLPQTTPIDGLYLAGQWTQPGEGIWTVIASGLQIARILLDREPASGLNPLNL